MFPRQTVYLHHRWRSPVRVIVTVLPLALLLEVVTKLSSPVTDIIIRYCTLTIIAQTNIFDSFARISESEFFLSQSGLIAGQLVDFFWLFFYVQLEYFSLKWRHRHHWWRAAKFWPFLRTYGFWGGRDLYRATPSVTRDLLLLRWYHAKDRNNLVAM